MKQRELPTSRFLKPEMVRPGWSRWRVAALGTTLVTGMGLSAYMALAVAYDGGSELIVCDSCSSLASATEGDADRAALEPRSRVSVQPKESALAAEASTFLVTHESGLWALLPDAWHLVDDPARLPTNDEGVVTLAGRAVPEFAQTKPLAVGDVLHLYGNGELVCQAKVTGFFALARHHNDDNGELAGAELWSMSEPLLAAALDVVSTAAQNCSTASWASTSAVPADERASVVALGEADDVFVQARRRFRRLSGYELAQKEFVSAGGAGPWERAGNPWDDQGFRVFRAGNDASLVIAAGRSGGCGEPGGELYAVWRVQGGDWSLLSQRAGAVVDVEIARAWSARGPQLIFSKDFNHRVLERLDGADPESGSIVAEDFVPYFGCRC